MRRNGPWSKFFWSDHEADEKLRVCSLAAQGLWMRMLCLMARATPRGELRIGSEPCSVRDLARIAGESDVTVAALLDELSRRGVFSTTRAGVIFSRRMKRDEKITKIRAENGAKGGRASLGKYAEKNGLLEQNPSKNSSKELSPRSQKPDIIPFPDGNGEPVRQEAWKPPGEHVDPDRAFWASAKAWLGASRGAVIGRWVRDHGREATARAIAEAQVNRAVDPVPYIERVLRNAWRRPAAAGAVSYLDCLRDRLDREERIRSMCASAEGQEEST